MRSFHGKKKSLSRALFALLLTCMLIPVFRVQPVGTGDDVGVDDLASLDWSIETVDSAAYVGRYTSLALDSGDNPHISYYDYTNGDLKYAYGRARATVCSVWTTDSDGDPKVKFDPGEIVYVNWEADGMVNMVVYAPDGVTVEQEWTNLPSSGVNTLVPSQGKGIYEIRCTGAKPTHIALGTFFLIPELPFYGSLLALATMLGTFFIMRKRRNGL